MKTQYNQTMIFNKVIRRGLLSLSAVLCGVLGVVAQEQQTDGGGFSKQIEVQKEYEVVVRSAERIDTPVRLLDTTIVRPELSYRITPTSHLTHFAVDDLRAMPLSTARWAEPQKLYLNVGVGLPLSSGADIYWSPVQSNRSRLTLWLNHDGWESSVTNLDNQRVGATLLRNRAGVDYTTRVGELARLSASLKYRGTLGSGYGGVGVASDVERPFVSAHDLEASANLSGRFSEESPLGYDANLMGLYAFTGVGEKVWRFNVNYGLLGLDSYSKWLPGVVTLHYSGVESTCREPYYDTSVTFVPEWSLRIGRWIGLELMAGYDHMVYKGAKNSLNGVVSSIALSYDKHPAIVPYLTVANDVQTKVTRDGLWNNPYMAMLPVDSRKVFLAEVGVRGSYGKMTYSLAGASRWFSAYMFERVVEGSPLLNYGRSNGQRVWYVDGELMWRPNRWWRIEGRLNYTTLGSAESATAEFRPRAWKSHLGLCYTPTSRWTFGLGADYASAMGVTFEATDGSCSLMEIPSYVDLGISAEYAYSQSVGLWLRGSNLLSQPIYHWATYRAPGAAVQMGVRMSF